MVNGTLIGNTQRTEGLFNITPQLQHIRRSITLDNRIEEELDYCGSRAINKILPRKIERNGMFRPSRPCSLEHKRVGVKNELINSPFTDSSDD